jgi:hypothetical protein
MIGERDLRSFHPDVGGKVPFDQKSYRAFPPATGNRAFCNTSAVAALLQNMLTILQSAE